SPALLSDGDPYHELTRVVWPTNILLTCTAAHGTATLPVPADGWQYLTVVDADGRGWPPPPLLPESRASKASPLTEVAGEVWRALSVGAGGLSSDEDGTACSTVQRLAGDLGVSGADAGAALAMYEVLRRSALASEDALALAVACGLIPRTASTQRVI